MPRLPAPPCAVRSPMSRYLHSLSCLRALRALRSQWAPSIPRELMAGAVATFALIPEVIAFAGGRPAMVSAAAGSVALVAAPLVQAHGVQYLFAAGLLAGALQILFGWLRLGVLMRYVSGSVRTGFVNALAILIFSAQLPHLAGANAATWATVAAGLAIIYGLPRLTRAVPSPLVCIVVLTVGAQWLDLPLKTVADLGHLPQGLPEFGLPQVPWSLQTLQLIALPALAIAMVGLLESMMTARVVDEMTDTPSSKNRECSGLGLANMASSLFGGIAGCGMIGQSVGNVRYGGRGRLSTLFAGAFLLILMVLLKPWVSLVPVAALVAIMVMVSASTLDWGSARALLRHPRMSSAVMVATVAVTVATDNLAAGVAVGVLLSGVFFAVKVSRLLAVTRTDEAGQPLAYRVSGQVFFGSADLLIDAFDVRDIAGRPVRIDLDLAHFWDITAAQALDEVCRRLRKHGSAVEVTGLNAHSRALLARLDLGLDLDR